MQAILITLSKGVAPKEALLRGVDVAEFKTAVAKSNYLISSDVDSETQKRFLKIQTL